MAEKKAGVDVLMLERVHYLIDQLKGVVPQLEELANISDDTRNQIQKQVADYALSIRMTKLKPEELEAFFKKPYDLSPVPGRRDSWYLRIPRFVDIQFGWLDKQTECYDEQTRVLTRNGFKFFKDLTYSDEIFTLNRPCGRMEYHKPTALHVYDYNGSMIHFKGQSIDLLVTPNHNVLVAGKHKCTSRASMHSFKLVRADSILEREDYSFSMLRAGLIWRGRWQTKAGSKGNLQRISIPEVNAISGGALKLSKELPINDFIRFIGWWLSEGSISTSTSAGYKQYKVTIANTKSGNLGEIEGTIRALGFAPVINKNPSARSAAFSSKQWYTYLQQFGHANTKYIPTEIKNIPVEQLRLLLETMAKGDGHSPQGRLKVYTTTSRRLADDVAEIGIKLGHAVTISGPYWDGNDKHSPKYNVYFSRQKMPRIRAPSITVYKGKVYCVTVPNHILLIERNGKICWSGNSYNTFIVSRYMDWLGELPEKIKQELGFKPPPDLKLDGEILSGSPRAMEEAWRKYRPYLKDRDEKRIIINKRRSFELIASLVKDGILPFTQKPVDPSDLVNRYFDPAFKLRPYQREAWDVFMSYSNIGVFFPASTGKTVLGLYLMTHLKAPHLVVVPTILLKEQWEERIKAHTDLRPDEYTVCTYYSAVKKHGEKDWTSLIIDECHHQPANQFSKLSFIKRKYTLGLSATPQREDKREELIFALTGHPVGLGWEHFKQLGLIKSPVCHVWIVKNFAAKLARLKALIDPEIKTIVFCDSIEIGKTISKRFDIPHVYGQTKRRLELIEKSPVAVVSRVGDEGISIPTVGKVIEASWLYGSRRQELQRFTRLLHGFDVKGEGEHHILMTLDEYLHDRKRLFSVMDKGFKVEIHREGISEHAVEKRLTETWKPRRIARPSKGEPAPPAQPVPQGPVADVLNLPGVQRIMQTLSKSEQRFWKLLLQNDGSWFRRDKLPLLLGYTSEDSMGHLIRFGKLVERGYIEQSKIDGKFAYRTNMRVKVG